MVKRQIGNNIFKNGNDLMIKIEKQWNGISNEYINKLKASMPNRYREVIKNKGFAAMY